MDTKRRAKQVFGGVMVLVGCVSLLRILGALIFGHIANSWASVGLALNLWNIGTLVLLTSLGVYFVCAGLRWINPQLIKPPRFGWGKIIFGSLMLFSQVGSHYHLVPEGPLPILKPSNPTEAVSMQVTGIAISLVCVYLIFRGIRAGFARRESQLDIPPPQSPESGQ